MTTYNHGYNDGLRDASEYMKDELGTTTGDMVPSLLREIEPERENDAQKQADAQGDSIVGYVEALQHASECDERDPDDCEAGCIEEDATASDSPAPTEKAKYCRWETDEDGDRTRVHADGCDHETYHDEEKARERLLEDTLEVRVRSGWYGPGDEPGTPEEYEILLCFGGPTAYLRGSLDENGEPMDASIECHWGSDTGYYRSNRDALTAYAREYLAGLC